MLRPPQLADRAGLRPAVPGAAAVPGGRPRGWPAGDAQPAGPGAAAGRGALPAGGVPRAAFLGSSRPGRTAAQRRVRLPQPPERAPAERPPVRVGVAPGRRPRPHQGHLAAQQPPAELPDRLRLRAALRPRHHRVPDGAGAGSGELDIALNVSDVWSILQL